MNQLKYKVCENTDEDLDRLYAAARRARDDMDDSAAEYYHMILERDPNSWEASFYTVYFRAMGCKIAQIRAAANSVNNCLETVFNLIKDNIQNPDEQILAVKEVAEGCKRVSEMLYMSAITDYIGTDAGEHSRHETEISDNCVAALQILYTLGDLIDEMFGEYEMLHCSAAQVWELAIAGHCKLASKLSTVEISRDVISGYSKKLQEYTCHDRAPG